jgi:hypothetical protein
MSTASQGPRWTRGRLADMLLECYGPGDHGGVNLADVAEYVGVTPPTVRRWISGGKHHRRRQTSCPPARIAALQRGPDLVERRNQQQYDHALSAIEAISDGQPIQPAWEKQGWLDKHAVAILAIYGKPWYQVAITKANHRALAELRRRGTTLDTVEVPTWFHGQVLAHTVMTRQQAWRVHPTKEQLAIGRTQVWMNDAPPLDLAALAATEPQRSAAITQQDN